MLDLAIAYTRYRFLGNEFLTWLWYLIENEKYFSLLKSGETESADPFLLGIGNRLVLENRQNEGLETITIKGDDAGLEEGVLALRRERWSAKSISSTARVPSSGGSPSRVRA